MLVEVLVKGVPAGVQELLADGNEQVIEFDLDLPVHELTGVPRQEGGLRGGGRRTAGYLEANFCRRVHRCLKHPARAA